MHTTPNHSYWFTKSNQFGTQSTEEGEQTEEWQLQITEENTFNKSEPLPFIVHCDSDYFITFRTIFSSAWQVKQVRAANPLLMVINVADDGKICPLLPLTLHLCRFPWKSTCSSAPTPTEEYISATQPGLSNWAHTHNTADTISNLQLMRSNERNAVIEIRYQW